MSAFRSTGLFQVRGRQLIAMLLVFGVGVGWLAAQPPTNPAERLKSTEEENLKLYKRFADEMLRLAQRWEKSDNTEDRERAKVLRAALTLAEQRGVENLFKDLIKGLSSPNLSSGDFETLLGKDARLLAALREILLTLQSEDEAERLRRQITEIQKAIAELKMLKRDLENVRARTENPRSDANRIAKEQRDLAQRTQDLADRLGGKDGKGSSNNAQAGSDDRAVSKPETRPGEAAPEARPDTPDSKAVSKPAAGQAAGNPAENRPSGPANDTAAGEDREAPKDPNAATAKPGQSASQNPADNQSGTQNNAGNNQNSGNSGNQNPNNNGNQSNANQNSGNSANPGQQQAGASKSQAEGKGESRSNNGQQGGQGKPMSQQASGNQGSQGSQQAGSAKPSGGSSSSQSGSQSGGQSGSQGGNQQQGGNNGSQRDPAQQNVQEAVPPQQGAEQDIRNNKREEASKKQDDALRKLDDALRELERRLKQLREKELLKLLANLEERVNRMLRMQIEVREATIRIDQAIQRNNGQRTIADLQKAQIEAEKEMQIIIEADKALQLMENEGSAVVFASVLREVRGDMETVRKRLEAGRVEKQTQDIEQDIIDQLTLMREALKKARQDLQNQPSNPSPSDPNAKQGKPKLIDLLNELKLVRSLQDQVNKRTISYSKQEPGEQAKDPLLQEEIRKLGERQRVIQEMLHKIATKANE
ncbi:MAG: hypothetical protein NZ703_02265 [Gemmataceae bacterium]|nr:hypothetical protein [Gemmataceae bacterium]